MVDGAGGFSTIDPAMCERLILSAYTTLVGTTGGDSSYFAIRTRGPDPRSPNTWYVQTAPMAPPTSTDSSGLFDLRRLVYDPTTGWQGLTLSPVRRAAAAPELNRAVYHGRWPSDQVNESPGRLF